MSRPVERVGAAIIILLGVRVAYLFFEYILKLGSVQRFHVESAALLFVIVGFAYALLRRTSHGPFDRPSHPVALWQWPVWCGAALLLFWPALSIGLLSDDFILANRAEAWQFGAVSTILFRPMPLGAWAILLTIGGGPVALHLLNIVLHGTNAYLTVRVIEGWPIVRGRALWPLLAGAFVLTMPLAPEAVVWCSGVFDVSATTGVLLTVLAARRYESRVSVATRVVFLALGIAAVLCKETAAVAVGFVLLDGWVRRTMPRALRVDSVVLAAVVAVFGAARLFLAFGTARPTLSRYLLQRYLFGPFGVFAVPWHEQVIHDHAWLAVLAAWLVIALITAFFLTSGARDRFAAVTASLVWLLLPLLPVWPNTSTAGNLEGARYFYLPAVGWALLLVTLAVPAETTALNRRLGTATASVGLFGLALIAALGIRMHLKPWVEAGQLRDAIETAAARDVVSAASGVCSATRLEKLPDSVDGAYVFRNGVAEAFARDLRMQVVVPTSGEGCAFEWQDAARRFVRTAR